MQLIKNRKIELLFSAIIIFILVLIQYKNVGLYFDDFGNASLSYGYDASGIEGTNYSISDLISWSKYIYFNWGGRILYAIIMIPMLKTSAFPFMLFQTIIITMLFVTMYYYMRNVLHSKYHPIVMLGFVMIIGLLKGTILSWGFYWASASVLYVLPMFPFFLSVVLYEKSVSLEKYDLKKNIPLFISILFVTLSQEQIGGAFLVWILTRIIIGVFLKERNGYRFKIIVLIWSLFTFGLFLSAPGNWARLESNTGFATLSVIEKIKVNYPIVTLLLTCFEMKLLNCVLCIVGITIAISIIKRGENIGFLLLLGVIPFANALLVQLGIIHRQEIGLEDSYSIFIVTMFFLLIVYLKQTNQLKLLPLMIAAVASVVCLLISPNLNTRCFIPYVFICMVLILTLIENEFTENNMAGKIVLVFICACFCIVSVKNLVIVQKGYSDNVSVDQYNANMLMNWSGEDTIVLKKYNNADYHGPASYDGFNSDAWIKEYYAIEPSVRLDWQ